MKTFIATLLLGVISTLNTAHAQDLALNKPNTSVASTTVKSTISVFQVETQAGRSNFSWTASSNEQVDRFELELSADGRAFATIAYVFASEQQADAAYQYFAKAKDSKAQYRLKLILKDQTVSYSGIIIAPNEKLK